MRAPGIVACLVVAVAAALVALATCTERAPEPPSSPPGGATQPAETTDAPADVRTARRVAPRAARAPVPGDDIAADDAAKAADVEPDPPDGDPVTFTIGVPQGTSMKDVRLRAWAMRAAENDTGFQFVALGGVRIPGDDGRVVIRTKDRGRTVVAYARAPGLHSRGEAAAESNGWTARIELGAGVDVCGVVTGADGRPAAGAEVRIVPRDRAAHAPGSSDVRAWASPGVFEHYVASVTANADGRYVVRGVPTAREGRTPVRHLPIARDAAGAWWAGEAFAAGEAPETFVRDVRLGAEAYVAEPAPERSTVRVRATVCVAGDEDTPIADASVALVVPVHGGFVSEAGSTSDAGRFDLTLRWERSLAEGEPELVVRAEGFRSFRARAASTEPGDEPVVRLVRDDRGEARGAIRGRATDEGAIVTGRLRINCRNERDRQVEVNVVADAQGRFRIPGLEPGWWRLSAGWPDRTSVLVRAGEETDAVVRAVRWEPDPEPWTDADEAAYLEAHDQFFETTRSDDLKRPDVATAAERERLEVLFHRLRELGERRTRRIARRAVRIRGIRATGRAWLTAHADGRIGFDETWIAEVASAEAAFAQLSVGRWRFELTREGAPPDEFRFDVPAGEGELLLDAASAGH